MSNPIPCAGYAVSVHDRLELFSPKLYFLADWIGEYGQRFSADGLKDCIPFVLRCLADEIDAMRDDLKPFTEAAHAQRGSSGTAD